MFTTLDWTILIGYLLFTFVVGAWMTRSAGKSLDSYFAANRSLPWWWLGISILATTFAADTPLAVTGITATSGIAGNWLWWCWAVSYITVAIVFAIRWRQSGVLTDVEFVELRYDGKEATVLRGFKAFYFGIIINCFILGWVTTAMTKITAPFIDWKVIANGQIYEIFNSFYPTFLLFNDDPSTTITVLIVTTVIVFYSALGGIRGVIITDLFQFAIAMITAVIFAFLAVDFVGGLDGLYSKMDSIYGPEKASQFTAFFPSLDNPMVPIQIFLIYVTVQWWARYDSDGTGYIAQRINTAKTPKDAKKGTLLFAVGFIALRSWPWIMVALVALVVFPLGNETQFHELGQFVAGDRESGYPILMKLILPAGLLGLTFTSLIAAFMSTVDTHLNWGSSYIVNDIYKRFINPKASQKQFVKVGRISIIVISILAVIVSSQMSSIEEAWKFFINMASGLGVAQLMRWLWWRANAWTEISAMITALVATFIFAYIYPEVDATYGLAFIAFISLIISYVVTLLTPQVSTSHLNIFIEKTNPIGFWKGQVNQEHAFKNFKTTLATWLLAITAGYSALFSIGYFLKLEFITGFVLAIVFTASIILVMKRM